MNSSLLEVKEISKSYTGPAGSKILILDKINFIINKEESRGIISIVAPFSSGKSTLLKIISSLESYDEGVVLLEGEKSKLKNEIIYIPEKPSSFPWMNVNENIAFALQSKKNDKDKIIKDATSLVGLTGYENHIPNNKSIGFRFRISLARALALSPKIILLDEPFKNMVDETKEELYDMLKNICIKKEVLFLLATKSVTEAILLSNKIILMGKAPGKIIKEISLSRNIESINKIHSSEKFTSIKKEIEEAFINNSISNFINISI